jgi:integral membrane sensor domain MASE1
VTRLKHVLRLIATVALVAAPRVALACPVCFGQSDSPLAKGVNMGVLFLLGTITAVLIAFASFMIYLARRAKVFADESV